MKKKEIENTNISIERKKTVKWGNHIDMLYSEIASSMKNPYHVKIKPSEIKKEGNKLNKSPIVDFLSQQNKIVNLFPNDPPKRIDNEPTKPKSSQIISNLFEKPCFVRTDRLYQIICSYNDNNTVKRSNGEFNMNDFNKSSGVESFKRSWNNLYTKYFTLIKGKSNQLLKEIKN